MWNSGITFENCTGRWAGLAALFGFSVSSLVSCSPFYNTSTRFLTYFLPAISLVHHPSRQLIYSSLFLTMETQLDGASRLHGQNHQEEGGKWFLSVSLDEPGWNMVVGPKWDGGCG